MCTVANQSLDQCPVICEHQVSSRTEEHPSKQTLEEWGLEVLLQQILGADFSLGNVRKRDKECLVDWSFVGMEWCYSIALFVTTKISFSRKHLFTNIKKNLFPPLDDLNTPYFRNLTSPEVAIKFLMLQYCPLVECNQLIEPASSSRDVQHIRN